MSKYTLENLKTQLPAHYLITGELTEPANQFLQQLQACLKQGFKCIQLRVKTLAVQPYRELAHTAIQLCRQYATTLLVNTDIETAHILDADGIHLSSARLMRCQQKPLGENKWVAAACHNLQELQQAEYIQADFATLSPVCPTTCQPQSTPLGWHTFAELAAQVSIPVYALGGMQAQHLSTAQQHGAHGIAAIRAFWDV